MDAADALEAARFELTDAGQQALIDSILREFDAELIAVLPPEDVVEPQFDLFMQSETWEV